MIARVIEWCARNRFLVFTGTVLLVIAGIWSLQHVPLDALPDISDVQVVIHTEWAGEPPNIIEDQVTYPLVTTFLAAAVEVIEMVRIIVVASAPFVGGGRPSLAPHRALAVSRVFGPNKT